MKTILALFTSDANYRTLWKKYWWWLPLLLLLALLHTSHLLDSDEGVTLNGAWEILHHQRLYLDFFEFCPPGSYYLLAAWWHLFPVSYTSANFLALLLTTASGIGIYQVTRQLGAKTWQWLPVLLFFLSSVFWRPINHNAFALTFLIWSVVVYVKALEAPKKSALFFLAGLLNGVTLLFLQHKGLALAGTYVLFSLIMLKKKKVFWLDCVWLGLGIILPVLMLFLWRTPSLLFENLVLFPLHNYPATNFVSLSFWSWALFLSCLLYFYTRLHTKNPHILFLFILQLVLLLSVLVRADFSHLTPILFPFYILVSLTLGYLDLNKALRLMIFLFIIIGTLTLAFFSWSIYPPFAKPNPTLYETIASHCPNDSFYAGPFMPELYFEFKKTNHLPYSFLITRQHTPEQFAEAARLLADNPPQCVMLNYDIVEKFGYTTNNPVDTFFAENYRLAKKFSGNTLLYILK